MMPDRPPKNMFHLTPLKRRIFFLVSDAALVAASMFASFCVRFDGVIPDVYSLNLPYYIAIALAVKLTILLVHDMYNVSWRFFGLKDLLKLLSAVTLSSVILGAASLAFRGSPFFPALPRSIVLVDYLLGLFMGLNFFQEGLGMEASRRLYEHGIWAVFAGSATAVTQFLPPLVLTDAEADDIIARTNSALVGFGLSRRN